MADCPDCGGPVLTAYVLDEHGNQWHVRCLDPTELDELDPTEIKR